MTILMVSGLLVPFILITDIFPFMRFGMFAEPIRQNNQIERFIIYQTDQFQQKTILDPEKIGINPNTFYYLCRNYIYRNEAKEFSEKIFRSMDHQIIQIEILHLISESTSQQPDTLYIGKYLRNE
jgi:hypothetical protein